MNHFQTLVAFTTCAPTRRGEWDDADEVGTLTNAADNAAWPNQFISHPPQTFIDPRGARMIHSMVSIIQAHPPFVSRSFRLAPEPFCPTAQTQCKGH